MALTDQTFLQLITRLAHEMNDCVGDPPDSTELDVSFWVVDRA